MKVRMENKGWTEVREWSSVSGNHVGDFTDRIGFKPEIHRMQQKGGEGIGDQETRLCRPLGRTSTPGSSPAAPRAPSGVSGPGKEISLGPQHHQDASAQGSEVVSLYCRVWPWRNCSGDDEANEVRRVRLFSEKSEDFSGN